MLIQTNHVAWMTKVGVAVTKANPSIGHGHQVNLLLGGDRGPVSLPNTVRPQSGYPSI